MSKTAPALFALCLSSVQLLGALGAPPRYEVADPSAPPVTAGNLLQSERFWPYQIELTSPFTLAGRETPLVAGTLGVLIRVEPTGLARIDFGRDGRAEVPVATTNLLAEANRIRLGEEGKPAPNLVHAIGPRLVDAEAEEIRAVDFGALFEQRIFLAVFADPSAEGFPKLAAALAPLRSRDGVETVLFPQGAHSDRAMWEQLRTLDWPVPFLRDPHSEGYTMSLRPEDAPLPAVMLLTPDGRVLLDRPWQDDVVKQVARTLDAELKAASKQAAVGKGAEGR